MTENKLICPFCQQELNYLAEDIYYCPNHQKYMGSEELWQELITTRKALDVAVDALKDMNEIIKNYGYGNGLYYALDGHDTMLVAEDVEKSICLINEITKGGKDV